MQSREEAIDRRPSEGGAAVPRPRPRAGRIALVSDQHLTGEAVSAALRARGHVVLALPMPRVGGHAELRRELAAFRPEVALLLQELVDPMHLRAAHDECGAPCSVGAVDRQP